ncbi:F-box-like domain superfamily [Arabidopsis suecica]|uniref:F-box-like domain superfamily n=1 Tax=Arabidopsis suecica TaxID=45249 RepID=A0A8T2F6N8_ARASU|nr:F-box-like domain superfamily [Arabidopsis suecica]
MAISDLPRDLVEEVLSRVPVTSLRTVRSTCKKWNIISKDESFTKKHVGQANAAARESEFQVVMMTEYKVYLMSVNLHGIQNNVDPSIEFKCKLISLDDSDRIVDFHPVYETEIYNFHSDSWKNIVDSTPEGDMQYFKQGVSLKGNTYWFARKYVIYEGGQEAWVSFLICFDFTTERFGPRLTLPFDYSTKESVSLSSAREEQLVLLYHPWFTMRMEIWVSNKIELNAVSWIKFLEVNMITFPHYRFSFHHVSFFIDKKNKVVVVLDKDKETRSRNLGYFIGEDGYFKKVELGGSRDRNGYPFVFSYVPSSVQF